MFFLNVKFKEGKVSSFIQKVIVFVSPLTFGVYLIHEHINMRGLWVEFVDSESLLKKEEILTKANTKEYVPIADYNPATKKYVDDKFAGLQIAQITQAEYDALETKDPNTLYLIVE